MRLKGIPAAPGISIGRAYLMSEESFCVIKRNIGAGQVKKEVARFRKALAQVELEFKKQRDKVTQEMGKTYGRLFSAYGLILKDPLFYKDTIKVISEDKVNVEFALQTVIDQIAKTFSMLEDEYMRERSRDVQDVGNRVLSVLLGQGKTSILDIENRVILVANALHPSDAVEMKKKKVMGFATDTGGRTSHVVIMADSLGIPAVVGLKRVTRQASPGDLIIIDGNDGYVHINPPPEVVRSYRKKKRAQEDLRKELVKLKDKAPVTRCGTNIDLCVNIESSGEASSVQEYGASGIGLFRTEFMYINRKTLPEEEEVYSEIKEVAEMAHPKPVVVRTIDLGADKMAEQLNMKPEMNSFMGMRGIRLSLAYPGLFKTHLRAILRASVKGNLVLMYPMITGIKELRSANHILREVKEDLDASGIEYDKNLKVGVMVETPAAVIEIERLARDADFLSIGTNDLIQYSLAVDRISEGVSHLYNPSDLAILGMLRMVIEAGRKFSRPVSMCGEMASDEFYTELLIGMGLRSFSMSGVGLPAIKQVVINADIEKCRLLAEEVLAADDNAEVIEILRDNRRQKRQF